MKSLYTSDFSFSPYFFIERMNQLVQKYGHQKALTDGKFKEEREASITAVFLLGYRQLAPSEYWINIPQDDPPDNIVVFPKVRGLGKGIVKQYFEVEVFEWERHSSESMSGAILKKLEGKGYPKDYFLLFQVRRPGELANLEECYRDLQEKKPAVSQIWMVSSIEDEQFNQVIACVYPSRLEKRFSLESEIAVVKNQAPILRELGRGITNKFQTGENVFIPLP